MARQQVAGILDLKAPFQAALKQVTALRNNGNRNARCDPDRKRRHFDVRPGKSAQGARGHGAQCAAPCLVWAFAWQQAGTTDPAPREIGCRVGDPDK